MHPVAVYVLITLAIAFAVILIAFFYATGKLNKEYDRNSKEHFYPYDMYTDEEVKK